MALAAVLPDEASAEAIGLLARVADTTVFPGAVVPATRHIEVGAVLLRSERRGSIRPSWRRQTLGDLACLPIETDLETPARTWQEIMQLAYQRRLSVYDVAYLELALRRRFPLASLDRALQRAAVAAGAALT